MDTKLTIKLDQAVIERAKRYAQDHQTNLSQLIENYLVYLTKEEGNEITITPLVKSLSGIIHLPEKADLLIVSREYLKRKYSC